MGVIPNMPCTPDLGFCTIKLQQRDRWRCECNDSVRIDRKRIRGYALNGILNDIKPLLEAVALVATSVGFVLGLYQVYMGRAEAQTARDLEITLSLSESFRNKWETSWRRSLKELTARSAAGEIDGSEEELANMLNWIDWLGNLIDNRHLKNVDVILGAIGPQMRAMMEVGRPVIEQETRDQGPEYWRGLLIVADRMGVSFDVG